MCDFFSFITLGKKKYYFDWEQRQSQDFVNCDSHGEIVKHYNLKDERINCYEYNPLTKELEIDAQHGPDDSKAVQKWCDGLDWKTIVEPLIVKPIINPLELPIVESPTEEQIELLKRWASVWASVWDSVWDSVGDSVWASVRASVWAYISSFIAVEYEHDFSACVKLWEAGLVPSFDGSTWRLHSGKDAKIVYEWRSE